MKKHNVLVDLKVAMNNGYCGIAKENRLVFKMLANAETIKTNGMLVSTNLSTVFNQYQHADSSVESIAQANRFFHEALHHEPLLKARLLTKLKFAKHFFLKRNRFNLYKINPVFSNTIWRNVFNKSLGPNDKETILKNDFYFSNLTTLHTGSAAYFKRKLHLDTSQHDFAIFLEPMPVSVSSNTIKIVRYHDAIPVTEPDFSGSGYSHGTINTLKICAEDSYFVCNSEPTREALLQIKPELESKTFMIPSAISSNYKKVINEGILKQIMLTRLSGKIVKPDYLPLLRKQIQNTTNMNYIFNLATLDPKKNHMLLINAWEKLNYQYDGQIKLVIAANSGWFSKETEKMMLPHIELGNIIHLDNLSIEELPYLLSHARMFVFPSYTEGFGLPPLEAMQCECPTIVSDIPAHRWVMGDASLYCDPYDADSLTHAMAKLLYKPDAKGLSAELSRKGLERVNRYTEASLSGQWEQLFDRIKSVKI